MRVSLIEFVKRHHLEDEEDVGAVTFHPGDSCLQWKSRMSQVVRELLMAAGADRYHR